MSPVDPLQPAALYSRCDPGQFSFRSTEELAELENSLGQDRAIEALRFGIAIGCRGYNMFALGPPGSGKHTMVRRHLEEAAAAAPVPTDWAYVNNFADPHKPNALEFPPGRARGFRDEMERLIRDMRDAIPSLFESDDYRARREALEEEFKSRQEGAFGELQEAAQQAGLALIRTPMGIAFAPVHDGEVMNPEAFRKLSPEQQEKTKSDIAEMEKRLQEIMRRAQQWEREHREKVRQLNQEMAERVVGHLIDEVKEKVSDLPEVAAWVEEVRADIIENAQQFLPQPPAEGVPGAEGGPPVPGGRPGAPPPFFRRYLVNVVVDRTECQAAPVIYEDHPTHPNLIGRIEHIAQFGALVTDFNLIKAGALLQANGGFLILDALKVLTQPYAWEELKRTLRAAEARIEGLAEALGVSATVSLQPEPIPLDVKVVLVGDRQIYYLLAQLDPEFSEMFKVAVDFDDVVDRSETTMNDYARMIATMARRDSLSPLDAGAVARVIEHASRLVSDSEKLSARMRLIADLLHESHFHAGLDGEALIGAGHVQKAIDAQIRRADRIRERVHEQITRGTVLIDTEGEAVGQLNGLSVLQVGGFAFGQPSRVSARVRLGKGEVVDIEREAKLGGPLHSKGVLILSGYLGELFAREKPLALAASLVFEQSYGGVDGDSASSTELYALLSALSGVPIRQCFAVTGSVNQHGHVQAIGGVNEKIEGFYDICAARGLTGEQGVLIPESNVKHLMLRADIVEAAAAGRFRIYPVATINQGIEILTGVPAGERGPDGDFPSDTINAKAQATLDGFAEKLRAFAAKGDDK